MHVSSYLMTRSQLIKFFVLHFFLWLFFCADLVCRVNVGGFVDAIMIPGLCFSRCDGQSAIGTSRGGTVDTFSIFCKRIFQTHVLTSVWCQSGRTNAYDARLIVKFSPAPSGAVPERLTFGPCFSFFSFFRPLKATNHFESVVR